MSDEDYDGDGHDDSGDTGDTSFNDEFLFDAIEYEPNTEELETDFIAATVAQFRSSRQEQPTGETPSAEATEEGGSEDRLSTQQRQSDDPRQSSENANDDVTEDTYVNTSNETDAIGLANIVSSSRDRTRNKNNTPVNRLPFSSRQKRQSLNPYQSSDDDGGGDNSDEKETEDTNNVNISSETDAAGFENILLSSHDADLAQRKKITSSMSADTDSEGSSENDSSTSSKPPLERELDPPSRQIPLQGSSSSSSTSPRSPGYSSKTKELRKRLNAATRSVPTPPSDESSTEQPRRPIDDSSSKRISPQSSVGNSSGTFSRTGQSEKIAESSGSSSYQTSEDDDDDDTNQSSSSSSSKEESSDDDGSTGAINEDSGEEEKQFQPSDSDPDSNLFYDKDEEDDSDDESTDFEEYQESVVSETPFFTPTQDLATPGLSGSRPHSVDESLKLQNIFAGDTPSSAGARVFEDDDDDYFGDYNDGDNDTGYDTGKGSDLQYSITSNRSGTSFGYDTGTGTDLQYSITSNRSGMSFGNTSIAFSLDTTLDRSSQRHDVHDYRRSGGREERDRRGSNSDDAGSRIEISEGYNPYDGGSETSKQPSNVGTKSAGTAMDSSVQHSPRDQVGKSNPDFITTMPQSISPRSQGFSSSSNQNSSSSGSKSYSERLVEMLRPFDADPTQSSRMKNTVGFDPTEATDIRSLVAIDPEDSTMSRSTPEDSIMSRSTPEDSTMSRSTPEDSTMSRSTPEDSTMSRSTPEDSIMSRSNMENSSMSRITPEDSIMSRSTPEDSTMSRSNVEDSSMSRITPEDSIMSKSTPEDSTMSRSMPDDSTMTLSTSEDRTRVTDITGSSNEEHYTLHSLLVQEDDSSYSSSDDSESSDEESNMADTNVIQSSSGSKDFDDEDTDGGDGGDDDSDDDSDRDDDEDDEDDDDSGDELELEPSKDSMEQTSQNRKRRRKSGSDHHEPSTGGNESHSGRSHSSIMSEIPESSIDSSESTATQSSTAMNEDIGDITGRPLLKKPSPSDQDDTSITRKNAEEFDQAEVASVSDSMAEDDDVGDIAQNILLRAIGASNADAQTSLPDENEVLQNVSKKVLKRVGDDGSSGVFSSTSNYSSKEVLSSTSNYSSKDDDIGDIARRILLKAIGSEDLIENKNTSDEYDQQLTDSESILNTEIERNDNDSILGESLGVSQEGDSDEMTNASGALGNVIECGESTSTPSSSVTSDDIGNIARNILLKAMGASVLNGASDEGSPSSHGNETGMPRVNPGDETKNDEGENSVSTTATSIKSDNIAAVARNIVNAAMGTSGRNLFGYDNESSAQHSQNEIIGEGKDHGGDDDSNFTPNFSVESASVGEIARKLVNEAIGNSNSADSPSTENVELQIGSEGPAERSNYFVHTSDESSVDNEQLSTNTADEIEDLTEQSRIVETPVDLSNQGMLNEGRIAANESEGAHDTEMTFAPSSSNWSEDSGHMDQEARSTRESETRSEEEERSQNAYMGDVEITLAPNMSDETEFSRSQLSKKEDDTSLSSGEIRELDNLLDRHENGEETDEDRLYELDLYDRWQHGEKLTNNEIRDLNDFKARRRKERRYRTELKGLKSRIAAGEDVNRVRLHQLELLERQRMGKNLTEEERKDIAEFWKEEGTPNAPSARESVEISKSSNDNSISELDRSDTNSLHTDVQNPIDQRSNEEDLPTYPEPSTSSTAKIKEDVHSSTGPQFGKKTNYEDEDDYSSLSTWELDELDGLIEQQEQGFDVAEDRLHNLELFDKWQNREPLDEEELKDLDRFKKDRKKERGYGRELINLIESKERGDKIDFERLAVLELYARHHTGEELTKDELKILTEFERSEDESVDPNEDKEKSIDDQESDKELTEKHRRKASSDDHHDEVRDNEMNSNDNNQIFSEELSDTNALTLNERLINALTVHETSIHSSRSNSSPGGSSHAEEARVSDTPSVDSLGRGSANQQNSEISPQEPSGPNAVVVDDKSHSKSSSDLSSHKEGDKVFDDSSVDSFDKVSSDRIIQKQSEISHQEPLGPNTIYLDNKSSPSSHSRSSSDNGDKSFDKSSTDVFDQEFVNQIDQRESEISHHRQPSGTNVIIVDDKSSLSSHSKLSSDSGDKLSDKSSTVSIGKGIVNQIDQGESHQESSGTIEIVFDAKSSPSSNSNYSSDRSPNVEEKYVVRETGAIHFKDSSHMGEKDMAKHEEDGSSKHGSCYSKNNSDHSQSERSDSLDNQQIGDRGPIDNLRSHSNGSQVFRVSGDDKSSYNSCRSKEEQSTALASQIHSYTGVEVSIVEMIPTPSDTKVNLSPDAPLAVDKEPSSSSRDESFSSRESLLSPGELDELKELRNREEKGESVDKGRIYELDILSRWHRGENLGDDELLDYYRFKAKRKKLKEYGHSFQEHSLRRRLVEKDQDSSPSFDYGRKNDDDKHETVTPLSMEIDRIGIDTKKSLNFRSPIRTPECKSSTTFDNTPRNEEQKVEKEVGSKIPLGENRRLAEIAKRNKIDEEKLLAQEIESIKQLERKKIDTERQKLEEGKRLLAEEEKLASLAEREKSEEEARIAKELQLIKDLDVKKAQEEQRRVIEEEEEARLKLANEQRRLAAKALLAEEQMKIEAERKQLAEDAQLAEESLLEKQKMRKRLEKEAQFAKENRISKENERKKKEQNIRDIRYLAERERAREVEAAKQIIAAAANSGDVEVPSFEETSNSSASDGISLSIESQLSIWEMDELNELLDREESGESVDEDRIYELDLISKYQVGEKLDQEEMSDLDDFRKRRRKHRIDRERQTEQKTRSPPSILDPSSQSNSRSISASAVSTIDEPQPSKLKESEGAKLKSRPSQRKREKQKSKQNEKRYDSSSSSSSSVRSRKADRDKSERTSSRSTNSRISDKKLRKRTGNVTEGSREKDNKNSNVDHRSSISIQSISLTSSIDKQDSNSLQSSGRASRQTDQPQAEIKKTESQSKGARVMSDRKDELRKTNKGTPSVFVSEDKSSDQQDKIMRPSTAIEKARHTLQAWETLSERSSQNSKEAGNEFSGLHDIERGTSSWVPAIDWDPLAYIKQRLPRLGSNDQSQNDKPDPPTVKVRPPKTSKKPRKASPIEESVYISRMTDDSSVASNWGPPSLLRKERSRKHSYNHRKDQYEIHSESSSSSSSPKEYGQKLSYVTESPYPKYLGHQIPFVIKTTDSPYESPTNDSRIKSDNEGLKGFDSDLLLSSWGFPVLEKVTGENPMRSKDIGNLPRNIPNRTVNVESAQRMMGTNNSYSLSSITSRVASITAERQIPSVNHSHSAPSTTSHTASLVDERKIASVNHSYCSSSTTSREASVLEFRRVTGGTQAHTASSTTSLGASLSESRRITGPNQSHSISSTSQSESLIEDRQIQTQGRDDNSDEFSQDFIVVEESIGEISDEINDFDLEQGISKLKTSTKTFEITPNPSEDRSSNRSSSSAEIDLPFGQNSIEKGDGSLQTDSQIDQSEGRKKRKKSIVYFVLFCLILLALIAGGLTALFIFLKRRNAQMPTPTPSNAPIPVLPPFASPSLPPSPLPVSQTPLPTLPPISSEPTTRPPNNISSPPTSAKIPTQAPISGNENDNIIIDDNSLLNLVVANSPDGGASLEDPSSPQSAALSWLQDPMNMRYSGPRLLQRYALATLYYATNPSSNWKTSSSWLTDTSECNWYSTSEIAPAVCTTTTILNSDGSSVYEIVYRHLDLRDNGLKGKIPDEISLLTDLKTIRLSKNDLTGSIPSRLATLSRLEYLDLSSNQLVQHDALSAENEIPSESDDERDVYADATTMSADDDTSSNIFTRKISKVPRSILRMGGHAAGSSFLYELQNMQSLIHLDLFENSFQTTIPPDIWGERSPLSSTLKVLNLGSNQFFGTLPTEIGYLTKLTGLSVFDNDLSGVLPVSISKLSQLELLYVDSNKFQTIRQVPGVPQAICELRPEPLKEFWADCEKTSCTCCTTCCSEDLGCITA